MAARWGAGRSRRCPPAPRCRSRRWRASGAWPRWRGPAWPGGRVRGRPPSRGTRWRVGAAGRVEDWRGSSTLRHDAKNVKSNPNPMESKRGLENKRTRWRVGAVGWGEDWMRIRNGVSGEDRGQPRALVPGRKCSSTGRISSRTTTTSTTWEIRRSACREATGRGHPRSD